MILPDLNLLVHAYNLDAQVHGAAKRAELHTADFTRFPGLRWSNPLTGVAR